MCCRVHGPEDKTAPQRPSPVLLLQGLALINGTQMITSLGAEAVERAQAIARQADIIAALTLEVLKGTTKAFDSGECSSSARDPAEK